MLAIWGAETDYGGNLGNFDLPRSLATLAYEGRRRALFENEFMALLKMVDQGVPRSRLNGSWAGAFGNPQFLPSAYLRVARDGDGDGRADIWTSEADTLASIGAYFANAGWRPGQRRDCGTMPSARHSAIVFQPLCRANTLGQRGESVRLVIWLRSKPAGTLTASPQGWPGRQPALAK